MNIELDEKEYRNLLDLLHIADVVLSGHRKTEDMRSARHRALIQKLYALAKNAGLDKLMTFKDDVKRYAPTPAFEESTLAHVVLDEFGEHLFWDHLTNRLSQRDAAQLAGGVGGLKSMSDTDLQRLHGAIKQRYIEEFSAHDITNLRLIDPEPASPVAEEPVKTSD